MQMAKYAQMENNMWINRLKIKNNFIKDSLKI